MRYFKAINSQRIVTLGDYSFKFEPAYRNAATGGSWGILQVEDEEAADVLAAEARANGVFEVTESEYVQALQKKSSLNINVVRHNESTPSAPRAEVKKLGETSSAPSAESIDDFMAGPKEEAPETSSEKDTQTSDETPESEAPATEAPAGPEPTIAEKPTPEKTATPKKQPAKKSGSRKSK